MPKSPAFIRIKADVMNIVAAIPHGRLCTFRSIGEHLDVMPRHVAYILTMLRDEEKNTLPWYRVVSDDGSLGATKFSVDGRSQAALLIDEGITASSKAITAGFDRLFIAAGTLKSRVAKQTRPADIANTMRTAPKLVSAKSAASKPQSKPQPK
jgi:methylated-DNA-protein-cysteine methyltransferase related protein